MKQLYQENSNIETGYAWQMERRKWLKLALAGVVFTQIPWITSCSVDPNESEKEIILDGKGVLSQDEMKGLHIIQNLLVPNDGNGPSAEMVNAHAYFIWTLEDQKLPNSEKEYFVEKLQDLLLLCKEKFGKKLANLPYADQDLFISNSVQSGWTQTYLSRMITVIFEAMLLDPIYGGNPNEIGWEWLEHTGGSPRATANTRYPEIFDNIPVYA